LRTTIPGESRGTSDGEEGGKKERVARWGIKGKGGIAWGSLWKKRKKVMLPWFLTFKRSKL